MDFPGYQDKSKDYDTVRFQPPGWAYVNPVQAVQAQKEQVKAGFKSREQVISENGYNIEDVDEVIARDKARAEKLGLTFETMMETKEVKSP